MPSRSAAPGSAPPAADAAAARGAETALAARRQPRRLGGGRGPVAMVTFSLGAKPDHSYEEAKEQDKKMAALQQAFKPNESVVSRLDIISRPFSTRFG